MSALHPDARAELSAAAEWYEDRHPMLGQDFQTEVRRAGALIADRPATWPRCQPTLFGFRRPRVARPKPRDRAIVSILGSSKQSAHEKAPGLGVQTNMRGGNWRGVGKLDERVALKILGEHGQRGLL